MSIGPLYDAGYGKGYQDGLNARDKQSSASPACSIAQWISVEDQWPKDGQYVWYFFEVTGVNYGKYESHTGTFYGPRGFLCGDVTHWMPAPEPPKQ